MFWVILLLAIIAIILLGLWDAVKGIIGLLVILVFGVFIYADAPEMGVTFFSYIGVTFVIIILWSVFRGYFISEDNDLASEGLKKCPFCAENVKLEAMVCKHCGRDVPRSAKVNNNERDEADRLDDIDDKSSAILDLGYVMGALLSDRENLKFIIILTFVVICIVSFVAYLA